MELDSDQPSLAEHLERARARRFVGRAAELAAIDAMLQAMASPHALYVYGPGGVGKTELLREAARRARDRACRVIELEIGALPSRRIDAGGDASNGTLIILDELSDSATERRWLARRLPTVLPANVTLLMAGRTALDADWTADAGWSSFLVQRRLEPFALAESRDFVSRCGVDLALASELHHQSRGHPLALALLVDARQGEAPANGQRTAINDTAPSAGHLVALRVAALARSVDLSLLAATGSGEDASAHLAWLMRRPYSTIGPDGLRLHDLVREAVVRPLIVEDEPEYWRILGSLLRAYMTRGWPAAEAFFALREHPGFGPMRPWLTEELPLVRATARHLGEARRLVETRAGDEAARLFDHWVAGGAEVVAVTTPSGAFMGFSVCVDLSRVGPLTLARDPLADKIGIELGVGVRAPAEAPMGGRRPRGADTPTGSPYDSHRESGPWPTDSKARARAQRGRELAAPRAEPSGAERPVLLWRFWGCVERDQAAGPVQARLFAHINEVVMRTPRIALALHAFRNPTLADHAPSAGIARWPALDCTVDGVPHVLIGVDFRARDPADWFLGLVRSRASVDRDGERSAFEEAVRRALDRLGQPDRLIESPLIRSRLVTRRAGPLATEAERARALAAVLHEAIDRFRDSVRDDDALAVLEGAFLGPRRKQDAIAASLGLSPATFRRRLSAALQRLKASLWEQEIRG